MKPITPTNMHFATVAPHNKQQGVVLITSLLVLGLLTTLSLTTLKISGTQEKMSGNLKSISKAQFAAEQGISKGISKLVAGTIDDTGSETSLSWNSATHYTDGDGSVISNNGDGYDVSYTVTHHTITDTGGNEAFPADLAASGNRYFNIRSTGTTGSTTRTVEAVVAMIQNAGGGAPYEIGLIGCDGIGFTSTGSSSSYSSSGEVTTGENGDISTTNENADITLGSHSIVHGSAYSTGTLTLQSHATINEDGKANDLITLTSNGTMGGAYTELAYITNGNNSNSNIVDANSAVNVNYSQPSELVELKECDPLGLDNIFSSDITGIENSNNNGDLSGFYDSSDDEYNLRSNSGTDTIGISGQNKSFYFENFSQSGRNSVITIQGDVIFYIKDGDLSLSGNNAELRLAADATLTVYLDGGKYSQTNSSIVNAPNVGASRRGYPIDLNIYANSSERMFLRSSGEFRGIIYAPNAEIKLASSADIRGAVRGKTIIATSTGQFIYDEDLGVFEPDVGGGGTGFAGYKLVYWAE